MPFVLMREEAIFPEIIPPDDAAGGAASFWNRTVVVNGPTLMSQPRARGCRFRPGARFSAETVMTGFGAVQRLL